MIPRNGIPKGGRRASTASAAGPGALRAGTVRPPSPRLVGTCAALACGAGLYPAAAFVNRGLAAWRPLSPWLSVIPEEALKLSLALAFVRVARGRREPSLAMLAAIGATAFGAVENAAYFLAFPDVYVYLRLPWARPLHANAGALFALALSGRRPVLAAAGAFALSCLVHGAFNALAGGNPSPGILAGGIFFNLAASVLLSMTAQVRFTLGGITDGSTRV